MDSTTDVCQRPLLFSIASGTLPSVIKVSVWAKVLVWLVIWVNYFCPLQNTQGIKHPLVIRWLFPVISEGLRWLVETEDADLEFRLKQVRPTSGYKAWIQRFTHNVISWHSTCSSPHFTLKFIAQWKSCNTMLLRINDLKCKELNHVNNFISGKLKHRR